MTVPTRRCEPNIGPCDECDYSPLRYEDDVHDAGSIDMHEAGPLPCSFMPPAPPAEETVDPWRVNVSIEPSPEEQFMLGFVSDEADCNEDRWYYGEDDGGPRGTVHLCPAACARVNAGSDPRVSIVFGCATRRADGLCYL